MVPDRLVEFGYAATEKAREIFSEAPTYVRELRKYTANLPGSTINHMIHNPKDAILWGAIVGLSLYAFVLGDGAEAVRDWFLPRIAKGTAVGLAVSIPLAALTVWYYNRHLPES